MTDPSTQLPIDYTAFVAEDFYVNDTVQILYLTDVFSAGPYEITLYKGILTFSSLNNSNELFSI